MGIINTTQLIVGWKNAKLHRRGTDAKTIPASDVARGVEGVGLQYGGQ